MSSYYSRLARAARRGNSQQSFGLQAELSRRGGNLARGCHIVLKDLERLAERCRRNLLLTEHNARAHKEGPALDVAWRTLQPICETLDHQPDCSIALVLRHCFGRGNFIGAWSVTFAGALVRQRRRCLYSVISLSLCLAFL